MVSQAFPPCYFTSICPLNRLRYDPCGNHVRRENLKVNFQALYTSIKAVGIKEIMD